MMTEPLAFLNGHVIPQSLAHLALNDGGFLFGATVTDLCRTFGHRLYRWEDHLARFRRSCQGAALQVSWSDSDITRHAHELIASNAAGIDRSQDLALVLFATPGPIGYYLGQSMAANEQPTLGMHTFVLPFARYRSWIDEGVTLVTPSQRQVPAVCVHPHLKQRSRMHWWLAEQEVRRTQAGGQALLLNLAGEVTETASSNVILVRDGTLMSPPRESVLEGVSLQVVSELCAKHGIAMEYRTIPLEECFAAQEVLLTCTSYCLAGVRQINQHTYSHPGPMLKRLLAAWNAEVGMEIHEQIRSNTSLPK